MFNEYVLVYCSFLVNAISLAAGSKSTQRQITQILGASLSKWMDTLWYFGVEFWTLKYPYCLLWGEGDYLFYCFCWLIENGRVILIMTSDLMEGYKDTHSTGMKNVVGINCFECHCLSCCMDSCGVLCTPMMCAAASSNA